MIFRDRKKGKKLESGYGFEKLGLGVAGSAFNQAFVAKVQELRQKQPALFSNPNWPLLIANDVAQHLPR